VRTKFEAGSFACRYDNFAGNSIELLLRPGCTGGYVIVTPQSTMKYTRVASVFQ